MNAHGHEGWHLSHERRHLATWSQGAGQGGKIVGHRGPRVVELDCGRSTAMGRGVQSWVGGEGMQ